MSFHDGVDVELGFSRAAADDRAAQTALCSTF